MKPLYGTIESHPDSGALARAAAGSFVSRAAEAVERSGRFVAVLTGGDSPREAYALLGEEEFSSRVSWQAVHLLWGDERAVAPDHPRSNFGMARRLFVGKVPIPAANVHRIRGELGAARAAEAYESELRDLLGDSPACDLVHLGVGDDGHVASLFPFDLPRLMERDRWVVPSLHSSGEPRVSLTLAVLGAARRVEMLMPGEEGSDLARRALGSPLDPFRLPVQRVRPAGELVFRLSP